GGTPVSPCLFGGRHARFRAGLSRLPRPRSAYRRAAGRARSGKRQGRGMKPRYLFLAITLLMVVAALWLLGQPSGGSGPRVLLTDLAHLPVTIREPYDEAANADAMVEAAFARAKTSGKRVMIILGGNWCADCIVLANVAAL